VPVGWKDPDEKGLIDEWVRWVLLQPSLGIGESFLWRQVTH
jgi:hypothetical protein